MASEVLIKMSNTKTTIAKRFRGFFPVIIDIETAGFDASKDAFIGPKPHPSWILNEDTCQWKSPVEYPEDGKRYDWNEGTTSWDEISE